MKIARAPDIDHLLYIILSRIDFSYIDPKRIISFRSTESRSRARARIWSFPRIWQEALNLPAHYVIEVLSEHFDQLKRDDQIKVLIHELLHIPRNFSGALLPHRRGRHKIDRRWVEQLFQRFKTREKRT